MTEIHAIPTAEIRAQFAAAMSAMYRDEVPKYGLLLDLVKQTNSEALALDPDLEAELAGSDNLQRLSHERHGAIRLGDARELATMRRLFAVMGMYPVGYYDLSEAGIPVHSTAFRPVTLGELNKNPFRIFTSLLRLDLIDDLGLRQRAETLLASRAIFTPALLALIDRSETQQGLSEADAESFVSEALQTFRWHQQATVSEDDYQSFLKSHRLIADIVCFKGPHINHLTPRTLDIDQAQHRMGDHGLDAKAFIEGPPKRKHPILLRQTSFKALDEAIRFESEENESKKGTHTARFGEIEQRGVALTPKGRALYDQLLNKVRREVADPVANPDAYYRSLEAQFQSFPDHLDEMHRQRLAYFTYRADPAVPENPATDLDNLIAVGSLTLYPITYEDFLPVSAAGIFQSNLREGEVSEFQQSPNQQAFENDLGCPVTNEFSLYAEMQRASLALALESMRFNDAEIRRLLQQLEVE